VWDQQVAAGDSPPMATGAITFFHDGLFTGSEEEWKEQMHHRTVGSNATSMNSVVILARAFQGEWSDYYQDEELVDRVVKALDYYTRAQGSNGGFAANRWGGGPDRAPGTNPLEGFGQKGIGEVYMLLHEEIEARGYLEETIDHDNNPDTEEIPRREAYVRMFEQGRAHVTSDPGRRIANQELANRTAMYVLNEALKKLEPEKAWSEEYILDDLYEATGTKPNSDAVRPYTVSPKGLGIEGLSYTDVGGFDANYGPHSVRFVSDLAKWTQDRELIERARTLTNAFAQYYSLTNNGDGDTGLIRNEAVSWRNNSMPGRVTYNPDPYVALQLQEPVALRQLHLYIQHGGAYGLNFESHNAHWLATLYEHLDLLEELDHELVNVSGKDARYARQLVNANPAHVIAVLIGVGVAYLLITIPSGLLAGYESKKIR
jgi:hypothetical protein